MLMIIKVTCEIFLLDKPNYQYVYNLKKHRKKHYERPPVNQEVCTPHPNKQTNINLESTK